MSFYVFFAYSIQNVFYWHQCTIILWMHIYIQSTISIMRNRQGVDINKEMVIEEGSISESFTF